MRNQIQDSIFCIQSLNEVLDVHKGAMGTMALESSRLSTPECRQWELKETSLLRALRPAKVVSVWSNWSSWPLLHQTLNQIVLQLWWPRLLHWCNRVSNNRSKTSSPQPELLVLLKNHLTDIAPGIYTQHNCHCTCWGQPNICDIMIERSDIVFLIPQLRKWMLRFTSETSVLLHKLLSHFLLMVDLSAICVSARRHFCTWGSGFGGNLAIASAAFCPCSSASKYVFKVPSLFSTISIVCNQTIVETVGSPILH